MVREILLSSKTLTRATRMHDLELAKLIDHTLLKPDALYSQIEELCREAREFGFFSVCISPSHVERAKKSLVGSQVKLVTVVGFPTGASTTRSKAFETDECVKMGADEIDMVLHIGALKCRDYNRVESDIKAVVQAASALPVKVILETCLLSEEEKRAAAQIVVQAGAHFVKTSTGFAAAGATLEDIKLLRKIVGPNFGVKASGGIRTREVALALVGAGANRLGASASVSIVGTGQKNPSASPGEY